MILKEIYSFVLPKKVTREVVEETEEGRLTKKVEQEVGIKVIFKRPSRLESEEADMIFAVEYGKCVRAGILTRPLIEKLYDEKEKSGILSDDFGSKYIGLLDNFWKIQNEFTALELKSEKTEDDEMRINALAVEFAQIKSELQGLESSRNSLFQNTAETKAQNRTILWLTLCLTYVQEDEGSPKPFFKGKSFEEKLAQYDELIEGEDDFSYKLIDKMAFFVALWYIGRASTKEDFTQIDKNLNNQNKKSAPVEEVKEEAPEEEATE